MQQKYFQYNYLKQNNYLIKSKEVSSSRFLGMGLAHFFLCPLSAFRVLHRWPHMSQKCDIEPKKCLDSMWSTTFILLQLCEKTRQMEQWIRLVVSSLTANFRRSSTVISETLKNNQSMKPSLPYPAKLYIVNTIYADFKYKI